MDREAPAAGCGQTPRTAAHPHRRRGKIMPDPGPNHPHLVPAAALLVSLLVSSWAPGCHALTTQGDTLLDENGNTLILKGASWFGFNNAAGMVDGLWSSSDGFTYDFATIIYRWQLLGFNAVRLPFSMQDLYSGPPSSKLSTSCLLPTFAEVAYSVTDPNDNVAPNLAFPPPVSWPTHSPNTCNEYLPNDSTLNRFIWVVQYLARNGFYVIIDDHNEDPTVSNSQALFVSFWVDIVTKISADPTASQRLIVDILNEPDARGWGWDVMGPLYLRVMDAVAPVNGNVVFLVEGCGQWFLDANWGDGFTTVGVSTPGSDPNPFFQALFSKPYLNNVVLGPHVYGPSVTHASSNYAGTGLWDRLTKSFGALTKSGYTFNGVSKTFAVVIGEVGSRFQDAGDLLFLADFAAYLLNAGPAADGMHNAIPSVIWWAWNDNSGDTGGIVDPTWLDINWAKVRYLNSLGLTAWYMSSSDPSPNPTPSPVTDPPPTPALGPTPTPDPEPSAASACQARVIVSSHYWPTELGPTAVADIFVQNLGSSTITAPWAFQMFSPTYTGQSYSWNFQALSFGAGTFSGVVQESWQDLLAPPDGREINIGFILSASDATFIPSTFSVNGVACRLMAGQWR